MKSVLYVLPATAIGGAETKFSNIAQRLSGVNQILLTHRIVAEYFSPLSIRSYLFEEYGCYEPMPVSVAKVLKYGRAIAEIVKQETIDCVVGIMHTGSLYASFARDVFRLRIPLIGTIEGDISSYFRREGRTPTFLEKSLLWYLLRRPSLLVAPSTGVRDDLKSNFGIPEERIEVIYNGIDLWSIRNMAAEKVDMSDGYNGKTIVTACRLNGQKDFLTLLRALKEVRASIESRLIIVGDGELRDEIFRQARSLGLEGHVKIAGFQRNPFKFMKTADVFVLSSFFEGFGNVIVEAMTLGIPVVTTDCPSGPREIIRNGVNGFLVPIQDHHAMAGAIIGLLTEKKLREDFAAKGMERAEHFKVESMVEGYENVLLKLCR